MKILHKTSGTSSTPLESFTAILTRCPTTARSVPKLPRDSDIRRHLDAAVTGRRSPNLFNTRFDSGPGKPGSKPPRFDSARPGVETL